jgi:hypothetical protein
MNTPHVIKELLDLKVKHDFRLYAAPVLRSN